jgi:hypothetical protein
MSAKATVPKVTVKVNMTAFNQSLRDFSRATGVSAQKLLPYHVASVMKRAMIATRSWSPKKWEQNQWMRTNDKLGMSSALKSAQSGRSTPMAMTNINIGRRSDTAGRTWLRLRPKGSKKPKFIMMREKGFKKGPMKPTWERAISRYSPMIDADVSRFESELKKNKSEAKHSTHFAKQSFIPILEDMRMLGVDWLQVPPLNVPGLAKILKATDRKGRTHRNGSTRTIDKTQSKLKILVVNRFPDTEQVRSKINSAIMSRRSAIANDIKHGVFKSADEVAKRYPFIRTL